MGSKARSVKCHHKILLALLLLLFQSGCVNGLIYTDITTPLTTNMHNTSVIDQTASDYRLVLKEPFTNVGIRGEWSNYAIAKTAKEHGMKNIHYADLREESILTGLWKKTTIIVYGR